MQTEGEGGGDISWFVTIEAWLKSTCCKYGRPAVLDCLYLPVEARYASASRLRFPGAALGSPAIYEDESDNVLFTQPAASTTTFASDIQYVEIKTPSPSTKCLQLPVLI